MARRDYAGNAVPATLSAGINSTDLTISISVATGWPSGGASGKFFVTIDRGLSTEERILINDRTGTTLNIASVGDRGADDTSAASHGVGATIEHTFSSVDADEANQHVNDPLSDAHLQYLNNLRHDVEARHQFGAALGTPSAPAAVGTVAAAGTGDDPAREDHTHIIGPLAINSSGMFANDVVGSAAIAAGAVGSSEIADGSVGSAEIATDAVGTAELGPDSVTASKIATGAVGNTELGADAVTTAKILDDAITGPKIADDAIDTPPKLADGVVTLLKIASQASTAYVPTFGGMTGGANTKYGQYYKFGRLVVGVAGFTLGGGGDINASITVSLPVACAAGAPDWIIAARGFNGSVTASGMGVIEGGASTAINIGTFGSGAWGVTIPFDWGNGDTFRCVFLYEAAV